MKLEYTVTKEDFIAFNVFYAENHIRKQLLLCRFLIPVVFVLAGVFLTKQPLGIAIFAAVAVFWVFYFPKLYRKTLVKNLTRMMSGGKRNEFVGQAALTLGESGVEITRQGEKSETAYNLIERVARDGARFYLFVGSASAYIVPFSAFDNEKHRQLFLTEINRRIKS